MTPKHAGGRPKGSLSKHTAYVAQRIARDGKILPLEVMVEAMRLHWRRAHYDGKAKRTQPEPAEVKEAAVFAAMAAPYIHPRLATQEIVGPGGGNLPLSFAGSVTLYMPDNGRAAPKRGNGKPN